MVIGKARPDLLAVFTGKREFPEKTTVSYALAEAEDRIVQVMEAELDVEAEIFDGVLVRGNVSVEDLRRVSARVKKDTGVDVQVEVKPWGSKESEKHATEMALAAVDTESELPQKTGPTRNSEKAQAGVGKSGKKKKGNP